MNRTRVYFGFLLVIAFHFLGCGGGGGDTDPVNQGLSNLVVEVILKGENGSNPNGDGSGTITLNFSAVNATRYLINFGDDSSTETSSNSVTHTYAGGGLRTFTIYVSAYKGAEFISKTITLTIKIDSGLIWSDEFDGNGSLDNSKWVYEIGNGSNGWGNGEKQYYTDRLANAKVENGYLTITAKKESYEGFEYTSSRVITKGKFDFKYGRVDIRAKLPQGGGTWPALWMLGSNISSVGWPACGEIDIMEHWGHLAEEVSSAIHTSACSSLNCDQMRVGATIISDYATEFHVYSMEWDENEIRFYIDDQYKYKYKPATKTDENWPFDKPQFLIMNVAMGARWFTIDPNFTSSTMQVDYVRVYQ